MKYVYVYSHEGSTSTVK